MPILDTTIINGKFKCRCDQCGKEFWRSSKDRAKFLKNPDKKVFCDVICSGKYKDKTEERTCNQCQKKFRAKYQDIKKGHGNFCSKSCNATYHNTHKNYGHNVSKLELWLSEKLWEKYPRLEIHYNKTDAINSELDIYIPSLSLAFELNGIFHYEAIYGQEKLLRTQQVDKEKIDKCIQKNIKLYQIDTSKQKYFTEKSSKIYLEYIIDKIDKNYQESSLLPKLKKPDRKTKHKKCKFCNKNFIPQKSSIVFCSTKCFSSSRISANKPSNKILLKEIQQQSYSQLSKKYGVSRATIGVWVKKAKSSVGESNP